MLPLLVTSTAVLYSIRDRFPREALKSAAPTTSSDIDVRQLPRKSVHIMIAPEVKFTLNKACVQAGGEIATFDNLTPDTSMVESWNWDFGDPASGTYNQSTLSDPTLIMRNLGTWSLLALLPRRRMDV